MAILKINKNEAKFVAERKVPGEADNDHDELVKGRGADKPMD